MLDVLSNLAGSQELSELISQPPQSLDITYAPPHVERLWWTWGEYRVSFHVIDACTPEEALWHPHDWPAAFWLVDGIYTHRLGHVPGLEPGDIVPTPAEVEVLSTQRLIRGAMYEMVNPLAFHSVQPAFQCYTLMLSGKPWANPLKFPKPPPQNPIPQPRLEALHQIAMNAI